MSRILPLLLLLVISIRLKGQEPVAELLSTQTAISYKNGKLLTSRLFEIRINSRTGEKYARASIPYSKLLKLNKVEAGIKDVNGNIIRKMQKSDVTDHSAIGESSFYEDDFVKEISIKHNVYPYIFYYSYQSVQEQFYLIDQWLPVVSREIPTLSAKLEVEVPADYNVAYKSRLTDSFNTEKTGTSIRYTWTASYKTQVMPETFSPSALNYFPEVDIVPQNFFYAIEGSYKSWKDYGDWHFKLLKGLDKLGFIENSRIVDLVRGTNDIKAKILILYHYLQDNTRYVNITIETGGYKAYPASFVAENKYGDCKALTNYFKSVLKYVGINSYYSLIHAGDKVLLTQKDFPSQQFNHAILCVPVENDTVWLDCTSKYPPSYLGTFTQGRDILLIDSAKSHFTRTPRLKPEEVTIIRRVKVKQTVPGLAEAEFKNSYKGNDYENLRYIGKYLNSKERNDYIVSNYIENGFESNNIILEDPDRDISEIDLAYSARSSRVYKNYGKDLVIEILPFTLPDFEPPSKRKLPVQIDYPLSAVDSLEYEIPVGYSVKMELLNKKISGEFGNYSVKSVLSKNKILVVKSFQLLSGGYELSKYGDLYNFIKAVNDFEKYHKIIANETR